MKRACIALAISAVLVGLFLTFKAEEDRLGGITTDIVEVETKVDEVEAEQSKYTDKYVQVLEGNVYPDDEKRRLDVALPDNMSVNVYDGPTGKGYQVVVKYEDRTEYIGYGPQAAEYTYTVPIGTATTTK